MCAMQSQRTHRSASGGIARGFSLARVLRTSVSSSSRSRTREHVSSTIPWGRQSVGGPLKPTASAGGVITASEDFRLLLQEAGKVPPYATRFWDGGGARRPPARPRACRYSWRLFAVHHGHGTQLWRSAQPPSRARQCVVETVATLIQGDHREMTTYLASRRRAGGRRARQVERACVQALRRMRAIG